MNWTMFCQIVLVAWVVVTSLCSATTGRVKSRHPIKPGHMIGSFIGMATMLLLLWGAGALSEIT